MPQFTSGHVSLILTRVGAAGWPSGGRRVAQRTAEGVQEMLVVRALGELGAMTGAEMESTSASPYLVGEPARVPGGGWPQRDSRRDPAGCSACSRARGPSPWAATKGQHRFREEGWEHASGWLRGSLHDHLPRGLRWWEQRIPGEGDGVPGGSDCRPAWQDHPVPACHPPSAPAAHG